MGKYLYGDKFINLEEAKSNYDKDMLFFGKPILLAVNKPNRKELIDLLFKIEYQLYIPNPKDIELLQSFNLVDIKNKATNGKLFDPIPLFSLRHHYDEWVEIDIASYKKLIKHFDSAWVKLCYNQTLLNLKGGTYLAEDGYYRIDKKNKIYRVKSIAKKRKTFISSVSTNIGSFPVLNLSNGKRIKPLELLEWSPEAFEHMSQKTRIKFAIDLINSQYNNPDDRIDHLYRKEIKYINSWLDYIYSYLLWKNNQFKE